jgi:hypothetical protein
MQTPSINSIQSDPQSNSNEQARTIKSGWNKKTSLAVVGVLCLN